MNLLIPGPVSLVEPRTDTVYIDMPRADELLKSVTDFLREQVMSETTGRTQFLARVAGNSLDIVQREMALGDAAADQERERLQSLLASRDTDLMRLREQLVQGLREGQIDLNAPGLAEHLRASIVNQINIDQPRYAGLATALNGGEGV